MGKAKKVVKYLKFIVLQSNKGERSENMSWIKQTLQKVGLVKTPTTTITTQPAATADPVRVIDFGPAVPTPTSPQIVGGITVTGGGAWSPTGRGGTVTKVEGQVTPEQIQAAVPEAQISEKYRTMGVSMQQERVVQQFQGREISGMASPIAEQITTPTGTEYRIRGQTVGRIVTDPETRQQYAQTITPSQMQFTTPRTSGEMVTDVILGDEGAELMTREYFTTPSLFPGDTTPVADISYDEPYVPFPTPPSKAELIRYQLENPGILMTKGELEERGVRITSGDGDVFFIPGTPTPAPLPFVEKATQGFKTFSNVITLIDNPSSIFGKDVSPKSWIDSDTGEPARVITTYPIIITPSSAALAAIAKPTKVVFTGVTQQVVGRKVITDAAFKIKYPTLFAKTEKGVITTITNIGRSGKTFGSQAVGRVGFTKLNFPTGTISVGVKKRFLGVSGGKAFIGDKTTVTISTGKIASRIKEFTYGPIKMSVQRKFALSKSKPFFDIGITKRGETAIGTIGKTFVGTPTGKAIPISPRTGIETVGLIKETGKPLTLITDVKGAALLSRMPSIKTALTLSPLRQIGLQQTQAFTRAFSLTISPTPTTIPFVSGAGISSIEATKLISPRETTRTFTGTYSPIRESFIQTSTFFPLQKQPTLQTTTTGIRQTTVQKQMFSPITIQRPVQIQPTRQTTRIQQRFFYIQRQVPRISPVIRTKLIPRTPTKLMPPFAPFKFKTAKPTKQEKELFPVLVRRRGEFKIVGYGKTPMEAMDIGKEIVSKTLARTFKVPGTSAKQLPGYKTKVTPRGVKFIEPSKRALGTPTELKEIQMYKGLKGGKKR